MEGIEGISHKVFLFDKQTVFRDIRQHISQKMEIASDSFWICVIEDERERIPADDDEVTLSSALSITIKMVSGSSYYNKETLLPKKDVKNSPRFLRRHQRSSSDPLLKRSSSFLKRMRKK